jgi:MFS family permease
MWTGDQWSSLYGRTFASLRTRNFRLFFVGQVVSKSGNWLTTVALSLLVLHRGGDGTALGLLSLCQFGPTLVLSAWAGLVADRSDKRKLLYVTQSLEMAESFALGALAFVHNAPLTSFYAVALAGGCMLAFDNPGRRSFVNEMVGHRELSNAVTLYNAMSAVSRILGPTLAGVLIVTLGYAWCFTVDGLSYLIALATLAMMRAAELRRAPPTARDRGQVRAGVRYVASVPELWITFALLLVIGIGSYNFTVVFPLFVERGLHGGAVQYTLLYAAFSAGGVLGTLVLAGRSSMSVCSVVLYAGSLGLAMVALSAVPDMTAAYPVAVLVGGTSVLYMTSTAAIAQLVSDKNMLGRVVALQTVLMIGTNPIGGAILGVLADVAGARAPMFVGGLVAVGAAVFGYLASLHKRLLRVKFSGRGRVAGDDERPAM